MGWLQLVGSVKLQVSFAKYSLSYRALLPKRLMIFREPTNRSHPILEITLVSCTRLVSRARPLQEKKKGKRAL